MRRFRPPRWLARLLRAERGSIVVMGALSLTAVLGMSGLAVEAGAGYAAKVRNQRVADVAALGAAAVYSASGQSLDAAKATAGDIAVANGLARESADTTMVTVGTASGIRVAVRTSLPVQLGRVLGAAARYDVVNAAVASVGGGTAACVVALGNSGNAVSVTGGTNLTASGCAITSNATVASDNSSAKISAKQIVAAAISDSAASWGGNAITTNPTANNIQTRSGAAADTIKATAAVKAALCQVNRLTGSSDGDYPDGNTACASPLVTPTAPGPSGSTTDVTFTSGTPTPMYAAFYNGGTYTLPAGNYTFRNVTVNGGVTVKIGDGDFRADSVAMGGDGMTFGNGKVIVSGSFGFNSGNKITIGNGEHWFGTLAVTGGRTLIVGSGKLTVGGAFTEDGGSTVKIAIGAGDAVTIGNNGSGTGISVAGGSSLCFTSDCAAPIALAGTFSANGTITTAGGSTLVLPRAATHVVNGNLDLNGSSILGGGLYVVKGNLTNNTGGTMTGSDVSFALGGTFTLSGGTTLDLAAPTGASGLGIADLLVATKTTNATQIGGGSQDRYSGLFYAPNSALAMSGGSSVSTNGSQCLMLVLKSIALSGSANITASSCPGQGGGGASGTPVLIQ